MTNRFVVGESMEEYFVFTAGKDGREGLVADASVAEVDVLNK